MINIRAWALALYISGLLLPGLAAGEIYILGVNARVDKTAAPQVLPLAMRAGGLAGVLRRSGAFRARAAQRDAVGRCNLVR